MRLKAYLAAFLFFVCAAAQAQFSPGQVLTAAQLNAALASPTITGGSISGVSANAMTFQSSASGAVVRSVLNKLQDTVNARDFGATCNGSGTGDQTGIQAAIAAIQVAGGGAVEIPPGGCVLTGTLAITASDVVLRGSGRDPSYITFNNGSADSIDVGFQGSQISGIALYRLFLNHTGKTGGVALNINNVSHFLARDVEINNAWNGILVENTNNVAFNNMVVVPSTSGASYGIRYYANTTGERSDVATFTDVQINAAYSGADCFQWDGNAQTLNLQNVIGLNCGYGLRVYNSANSTSLVPNFLFADNLQIDGTTQYGVSIEAGQDFTIVNSDIDNNNSAGLGALRVLPDASYSVTRAVRIAASNIHNTPGEAALLNAHQITMTGVNFSDTNKGVTGTLPAVEIGASAFDVTLAGSFAGQRYGDGYQPSYGVQVDSGASRVVLAGNNYYGAATGSVNDLSGNANFLGGVSYSGAQIGPVIQDGGTSGTKTISVTNNGTTSSTKAIANYSTGTSNAYLHVGQIDGSSPSAAIVTGSGDTGGMAITNASGTLAITSTATTISGTLSVGGTSVKGNLSGTTGSIGGSALAAGACATGTVSVSGATTSMAVAVSPAASPGAGYVWEGYVSTAGTVTVNVCAIVAGTPTATTYNVRACAPVALRVTTTTTASPPRAGFFFF